jgi:hypothetical protein
MKRAGIFLFLFICMSGAHAVTHLYLNNTSDYTITAVPAKIVLTCDTASSGNSVACEIFVDVNGNRYVDTDDERIHYLNLVDGLGWIYDGDLSDNAIPGDETGVDGFIRTHLLFDDQLRPYSPQTWLIRVTDSNLSSVTAHLNWDIAIHSPSVRGTVQDEETGEALPNVLLHFRDAWYPEIERHAITNSAGEYSIQLAPGDWQVVTSHPTNKEYRRSVHSLLRLNDEQSINLNINVKKYAAFVTGQVHFANSSAVENITVALQNTETMDIYFIRTNENGDFKVGLEPGEYVVTTSQYYSRYLGNHYWPEGFYAQPAVDTVVVKEGERFAEEITFLPYNSHVNGTCHVNGMPLVDVLVQGIAVDPISKKQKLYQTFSKADGSYSLGVGENESLTIIAQKEGFTPVPVTGFKINAEAQAQHYSFQFKAHLGLMTLGGSVYGEKSQPLSGVHVVAYNIWDHTPHGHLITQTDENGRYFFDIKVEGDWQIGVFKKDAEVHPEMYYQYMSTGLKYDDLNFVVSNDQQNNTGNGRVTLADFSVVPHQPNPFYKETVIDFVLPKSSHTQVDVLDMNGKELTTLVNHNLSSGFQKVRWDGKDASGNAIANGVYWCRVTSKDNTALLPITLLR